MSGPPGFVGPRTRSGLTALKSAVQGYFDANNIKTRVYLGLRGRDHWDTSRVVLIDGEFNGDNTPRPMSAGVFRAPGHSKSVNPRELVEWRRQVTASIRGVDNTDPNSEEAQVEATELLIEQTLQALQNAMYTNPVTGVVTGIGQANLDFGDAKCVWVEPGSSTQQVRGKEFLVTFTYRCPLYDSAEFVQQVVGTLQKGPLLTSPIGGVNAVIKSAAGGTAVITGIGNNLGPDLVGMDLTLSGAAIPGNNGTFPITYLISPTQLVITNAGAVAPDANSGAITWQVGPPR